MQKQLISLLICAGLIAPAVGLADSPTPPDCPTLKDLRSALSQAQCTFHEYEYEYGKLYSASIDICPPLAQLTWVTYYSKNMTPSVAFKSAQKVGRPTLPTGKDPTSATVASGDDILQACNYSNATTYFVSVNSVIEIDNLLFLINNQGNSP